MFTKSEGVEFLLDKEDFGSLVSCFGWTGSNPHLYLLLDFQLRALILMFRGNFKTLEKALAFF